MTLPETKVKCNESVSSGGGWPSSHRCTRNATVERDGKPYCTQHDTERIKAEKAARNAVCHYKASLYARECGLPALAERDKHDWKPRCARHTEEALAADKRLRDAAPALLAALVGLLDLHSEQVRAKAHRICECPFCEEARAAIEKAEGQDE